MKISASVVDLASVRTECAVVPLFEGGKLTGAGEAMSPAWRTLLERIVRRADTGAAAGDSLLVHGPDGEAVQRVLLLGLGAARGLDRRRFAKAVGTMVGALAKLKLRDATVHLLEVEVNGLDAAGRARLVAQALVDGSYRSDTMKSEPSKARPSPARATLATAGRRETTQVGEAVAQGVAIGEGRALARGLGNLPGNVCTPRYLADAARSLGRGSKRMKVKVLTETEVEKLGMGSFLAVAAGSAEPPRLIAIEYSGGDADRRPVVLVGKGVTFDSGGISIKPAASMDEMKFDMCGAASVLGTLKALDVLAAPVNVVGLVVATENLPSATAVKPGDIVKTMAGKTVEILNTDAEGRLILCDALTYAERFEPDAVIDIATLTGACVVALGAHPSGLFANDDALAQALVEAGERADDRAWRLPLWDEYQEALNSNFADVANVGGRSGGAITAACFLARFAEKYRWAHLDIAGTAWHSGNNKGATGRPVGLLTQYILARGAGRKRSGARARRK